MRMAKFIQSDPSRRNFARRSKASEGRDGVDAYVEQPDGMLSLMYGEIYSIGVFFDERQNRRRIGEPMGMVVAARLHIKRKG